MRTVKFRGKVSYGEESYGKWVKGQVNICRGVSIAFMQSDTEGNFKVDKDTVGQYTGIDCRFKDSDVSAELYEGDIVKFTEDTEYRDEEMEYPVKKDARFVCSCCGCGFVLVPLKMYKEWDRNHRNPETLGLIHNFEMWKLRESYVPIGNITDDKKLL